MSMSISGFNSQTQLLRLLQASLGEPEQFFRHIEHKRVDLCVSTSSTVSSSDASTAVGLSAAVLAFLSQLGGARRPTAAARVQPAALRAAARRRRRSAPRPAAGPPPGVSQQFELLELDRQLVERHQPAVGARDRSHQSADGAAVVEFVVERLERVDRLRFVVVDRRADRLRCHAAVGGAETSSPMSSRPSNSSSSTSSASSSAVTSASDSVSSTSSTSSTSSASSISSASSSSNSTARTTAEAALRELMRVLEAYGAAASSSPSSATTTRG